MDVEGSWFVLGSSGRGTAIIMKLDANAGRCQTGGDGSLDFRNEQVAVVEVPTPGREVERSRTGLCPDLVIDEVGHD